jgi:hypothetical protein
MKNLTNALFVMGIIVMLVLSGCERFTKNKSAVNEELLINIEKITQDRNFDSPAVSKVLRNEYAYGWIKITGNSTVKGIKVLQSKTDMSRFVNVAYPKADSSIMRISGFAAAPPGTYTLSVQVLGSSINSNIVEYQLIVSE